MRESGSGFRGLGIRVWVRVLGLGIWIKLRVKDVVVSTNRGTPL